MFLERIKNVLLKNSKLQEKSEKRIEQEKMLYDWKRRIKRVSLPILETELDNLEKNMYRYPLNEFDEEIKKISEKISNLQDNKEKILLSYDIGYKFSKSKRELAEYFSEGLFISYPEMYYVEIQNEMELSFSMDKSCLLDCAVYGDQLTQIPLNIEHPYYHKLENAEIKHRGGMLDEYCSNILLTGKNISLKNPYVLKEVITLSDDRARFIFSQPLFHTKKKCKSLESIYREIGFVETADLCSDISKNINRGKNIKTVIDEILPDKNGSVLDKLYLDYMDECIKMQKGHAKSNLNSN